MGSYSGLQVFAPSVRVSSMAPYPKELRVRVVAAVEEGQFSIPAIARLFQVGVTFVKKMLRLHRTGKSLTPRHGGGPIPRLQAAETTRLRQELQAHPDATLAELQQVLVDTCQTPVSLATICRYLQVLRLPRKKRAHPEWARRAGPAAVPRPDQWLREQEVCLS